MPVETTPRAPRPVASKQQFRDEIVALRKTGGRLIELLDLITTCGITGTAHDRARLADLRRRWAAIKRSEGK